MTHPPHIDMHKAGIRILPDTARPQASRGAAELIDADAFQADIDRLALHMQRMLRHAIALAGQPGIGGGGAIARDHLEGALSAHAVIKGADQIDDARVHIMDAAGIVIAQQMIDGAQSGRLVAALGPIDRLQRFIGVNIVERDNPLMLAMQGSGNRILQQKR